MKPKNIVKAILNITAILPITVLAFAADDAATYLIMNDIGHYYRLTETIDAYTHRTKTIAGYTIYNTSGVLAGGDHFTLDHDDTTYRTEYQSDAIDLGMDVELTQHAGSDSDKWLLHEVEETFQKARTLGASYAVPYPLKDVNGNRIYFMWGHYKWISNNVVVAIDFSDLTGTKPEPLEVVQAYLQKFPSTIPATLVLNDAHKIQWIKDEMDRRLWLCDKWFMQLQLKKAEEKDVYREAVKSMDIFLDYREKYYGVKAAEDESLVEQFLMQNNGTGIRTKLKEYKDWWAGNKDTAISL